MLAVSDASGTEWLVTSAVLSWNSVPPSIVSGVVVAYHTLLVAGSFVVHMMLVELAVVLVAERPVIVGAVMSGGGESAAVVNDRTLEVAVLPDASFDSAT